ncbi:MAG: thiosulfate dehydrogenase (quinone) large subunit [Mucilaginibacter sp.]|nr:thiosulfate dehydrogenase (quinone) large subunit [Mucilaginibacter sp.]
MKKEHYTYLLARLPIALSFFGHGLVRMTKLETFSNGMVNQFSKSLLPQGMVLQFSHLLPFLELITGILLLLGIFTRFTLVLGAVIMMVLIFGSCMIEAWEAVFTQLIYGAYLALLFNFTNYNRISIDGLMKPRLDPKRRENDLRWSGLR